MNNLMKIMKTMKLKNGLNYLRKGVVSMKRATDEDIKKIKKGDTFLVDLKHDGNVNELCNYLHRHIDKFR